MSGEMSNDIAVAVIVIMSIFYLSCEFIKQNKIEKKFYEEFKEKTKKPLE